MYDELELDLVGDRKTALFFIISDTDATFNFLVSMAYTQLFNLLCERADDKFGGRLPVHVRCLIDEAANIGQIPNLEKLMATIRSREISACLVLQAQSQLKALYKYGIVYADPPWRYDMKRGKGVAENHYPTMSMDEICALPVADLAAKDSALFLWATFPQLNEAFRVIEAWGFHYKTLAFLWLKQNRKADSWFYGMGFWTRSNAEVCLLATRGHPKRQCAGIHQFVISHIEQHSKKPDEVRDKIIKLMGDQPRVELFARQQTPGWDVWGNEVDCSITMPQNG